MYNFMISLLTEWRDKLNNRKIIDITSKQLQDVRDVFEQIEEWRDIDNAKGVALDKLGAEIGQPRGEATDEIYRILIKAKLLSVSSKGDLNSILTIISTVLGVDPSEFTIKELYTEGKPAMLEITEVPLDALNKIGLSGEDLVAITKQSLAGGVGIESLTLEGTFEFSDKLIHNSEKGFDRGTLGAAYKESDQINEF